VERSSEFYQHFGIVSIQLHDYRGRAPSGPAIRGREGTDASRHPSHRQPRQVDNNPDALRCELPLEKPPLRIIAENVFTMETFAFTRVYVAINMQLRSKRHLSPLETIRGEFAVQFAKEADGYSVRANHWSDFDPIRLGVFSKGSRFSRGSTSSLF